MADFEVAGMLLALESCSFIRYRLSLKLVCSHVGAKRPFTNYVYAKMEVEHFLL